MDCDQTIKDLLAIEQGAQEMASQLLLDISQPSDAILRAARQTLLDFLRGPAEQHMQYEERFIFPLLGSAFGGHDFHAQLKNAVSEHNALRKATSELALADDHDVVRIIGDIARLIILHTKSEADSLYSVLTKDEWAALLSRASPSGG